MRPPLVLVLTLALAALTACALLRTAEAELADQIARYCREPTDKRAAMRDYINAAAKPNAVTIACAADKPKP